ncbi:ABC transporter permease [Planctomycetes bacterium K23_9]|uniref:FtsX-like permease family protein n=1 Tax=Stieleria marina TaxID=1930275 RepID=A0A517NSQ4_9BACT|nr:FtsX-like permease family protein [Planctomycetes bacterium K23_9]
MLLPWEYGVRNLARRPVRTALTLVALATVVMLVFVVVGFIRGLEQSLSVSGDDDVVLVYSVNSEENIENSSIAARTPALLTASLDGTVKRFGITCVSPELYLGTRVTTEQDDGGLGLVRGVTTTAPLVRRSVKLIEGEWPREGEVMVGRLAAAKMGSKDEAVAIGKSIAFEGRDWQISGRFAAGGAAYESEVWCRLGDFQTATKRQDLSLAAMLLSPGKSPAEVSLFCKERTDLELRAIRETDYYASLQQHYKPVRLLAWFVVILVSGAGIFAGLNMMYGAVAGRIREIATLQAIGYRRRAILLSLVQEGVLLAAAGSLLSGVIALTMLNGMAVRFTMGAFVLRIDSVAILIGCGVGLLLGVLGALPPALKALRGSVAISLKAV